MALGSTSTAGKAESGGRGEKPRGSRAGRDVGRDRVTPCRNVLRLA